MRGSSGAVSRNDQPALITNEELLRTWFGHLRARQLRGNTIYTYEATALALARFCGRRSICDATTRQLDAFVLRRRTHRGVEGPPKPSTVARDAAVLRTLYRWLVSAGYIDRSPCDLMAVTRVPLRQPRAIADAVWLRLWSSELTDDARVALGLGYFVGLRRAEITSLAPHQVDLSTGRLVYFRRKGGGDDVTPYESMLRVFEERLPVVLGATGADPFREALERLVRERQGAAILMPWDSGARGPIGVTRHELAPGQIDPQRIAKRLSTWQRRAGLGPKAFSAHQMRHSAITNLLRAGVPLALVSKLANHANVTTTMGYAKLGESELDDWLRTNRFS